MAKFDKTSFMKELKTWTKPTKGIQFTPFKAAYSIGKLAFRHPYISTALAFAPKIYGKFKGKLPKRPKISPWTKKGRWML